MTIERKRALITGITGQDGSYLAELLLAKGYEVHGLVRRSSGGNMGRIEHLRERLHLHPGDLTDGPSLTTALVKARPDEVYNLAAQSDVRESFDLPDYTADVDALGVGRLLEAIRRSGLPARFYQASSSEMFGSAPAPQNEATPFHPRSPYAAAKVHAHHLAQNYREAYGLFACSGILFNHESPRRGEGFVTRKITRAVGRILAGRQKKVVLGNLDAARDWGFAGDYVEAMWKMLQRECAEDFVIATGVSYRVEEFLHQAFRVVDLDWRRYVDFDAALLRPTEVDRLCGDATKARRELEWVPSTRWLDLVRMMVLADVDLARREALTS